MFVRRVFAAAVLTAATLAAQPGGMPIAAGDPCPNIEVIFARGTRESAGIGALGQAFVDALRPQIGGRTLSTYGVNYPASYDFLAAGNGSSDASSRISATATSCPSTRIVLGGYSQGAAVMDMLGNVPVLGTRLGTALSPTLANSVAAVAVFGNPATKFGNPITSSTVFGGRAIDLCKDGDPICSDGRNPFAHNDYVSEGFPSQAADFVAGLV